MMTFEISNSVTQYVPNRMDSIYWQR